MFKFNKRECEEGGKIAMHLQMSCIYFQCANKLFTSKHDCCSFKIIYFVLDSYTHTLVIPQPASPVLIHVLHRFRNTRTYMQPQGPNDWLCTVYYVWANHRGKNEALERCVKVRAVL